MEAVTFAVPPGTHIDAAAVALVGKANMARREAVSTFNGVELRAAPGDDPGQIVERWTRETKARAAAWRRSPEGKAAAAKSAAEVAALQAKADKHAAEVGALDFADHDAVLRFLTDLQPCSDRIGVKVAAEPILTAFAEAGLVPGMCCGAAFNGDDETTFFRWLVGQALDGLATGPAIHGLIHRFADEWRAKWGSDSA